MRLLMQGIGCDIQKHSEILKSGLPVPQNSDSRVAGTSLGSALEVPSFSDSAT